MFHFDRGCRGLAVPYPERHGRPAFTVWYTVSGERKRITIGDVAGLDLEAARRRAGEIIDSARDGRDAATERKQSRAAAAAALTMSDLIAAYLTTCRPAQRPRTLIETKRALNRHWAALRLRVADVTRRDISARLIEVSRSTGTVGRTGHERT